MIVRERMSADVHQEILRRIIEGSYAPGQRLRDAELAESLGVSRTPVREALLRLEREGFVSAQKHLGFSVKGLAEEEIREVYPLVRLLECSALDGARLPDAERLGRLERLGRALVGERDNPLKRIELDSAWHEVLLEGAGNGHLKRILSELKRIMFRYEYAFMEHEDLVCRSAEEHGAIGAALAAGSRGRAVELLGEHWDRCAEATIAEFLSPRADGGTGGAGDCAGGTGARDGAAH